MLAMLVVIPAGDAIPRFFITSVEKVAGHHQHDVNFGQPPH